MNKQQDCKPKPGFKAIVRSYFWGPKISFIPIEDESLLPEGEQGENADNQ